MASQTPEAKAHRARQTLRAWPRTIRRNDCDWLHDTAVTNRAEKRAALAQAKKYRCEEAKEEDKEKKTRTSWKHTPACPKWKPEPVKMTLAKAQNLPSGEVAA